MMKAQKLTREQCVIITGFTGIITGYVDDFHKDLERRVGRSVQIFEWADQEFWKYIKNLYAADFIEMCTVNREE